MSWPAWTGYNASQRPQLTYPISSAPATSSFTHNEHLITPHTHITLFKLFFLVKMLSLFFTSQMPELLDPTNMTKV